MKLIKHALLLCTIAWAATPLYSCDLCNCYFQLNPHDRLTSIGFQYRYSTYHEHAEAMIMAKQIHPDGTTGSYENYRTYDLWATWYPMSKLVIQASVPFRKNSSTSDGTFQSIGDMTVVGQYQIFETLPRGENPFQQRFYVGTGVQLPTGKFEKGGDAHVQTGVGSTSYLVMASYLMRKGLFGISSSVNYAFNGENSSSYRFANRTNLQLTATYQKSVGNTILRPGIGFQVESAKKDRQDNTKISGTGGTGVLGVASVDLYIDRMNISGQFFTPVKQAYDHMKNRYRFALGLSYAFTKGM